MLADTHAHLYWPDYKSDLSDVLKRAKNSDIDIIINVGVDVELSKKALQQAEQLHGERSRTINLYSTVGIHPHEALRYTQGKLLEADINALEAIYKSNPAKVISVGEVGLDYLFESNPNYISTSISIDENKLLQRRLFQAQIALAKKINLPLLIHVRDDRSKDPTNTECWDEALDMIKGHFGILHCYSGLEKTTYQALSSNFLISFAANITYPKNEYLRQAARLIPLDRIVLETDSPFLSPQNKRGQRNEPSSVLEIAQLIAEVKGVSLETVANQTTENVKAFLGF